jgi:TadE-like protein
MRAALQWGVGPALPELWARLRKQMKKQAKKWLRADGGVVAIEFAMVSIPFFLMLMGTVETSLYFAAGLVLEGGTAEAARVIRTGEAQSSGDAENAFRTELCSKVSALINCNNLRCEVIGMGNGDFSDADDLQPHYDADGNLISQGFDPGEADEVILVRASYKYEFLTPWIGAMMTGSPTRNWVNLLSTAAIKNEPF